MALLARHCELGEAISVLSLGINGAISLIRFDKSSKSAIILHITQVKSSIQKDKLKRGDYRKLQEGKIKTFRPKDRICCQSYTFTNPFFQNWKNGFFTSEIPPLKPIFEKILRDIEE